MDKKSNVIDLESRRTRGTMSSRLLNLKVRFDLEHARVAVPASLLSIVLLMTLANNSIMKQPEMKSQELASVESAQQGRAIASVSTGTSQAEDRLVKRLSESALSETALVGRRPSSLDNLTLGLLEGKYAVRLHEGKVREIEFADANPGADRPKHISDREAFLQSNAEILPYEFEKPVKVEVTQEGTTTAETYHLVNGLSMPVAKVQFRLDAAGRLLSMRVSQVQLAAK